MPQKIKSELVFGDPPKDRLLAYWTENGVQFCGCMVNKNGGWIYHYWVVSVPPQEEWDDYGSDIF